MNGRIWIWALATAILVLVGHPIVAMIAPGNSLLVAGTAPLLGALVAFFWRGKLPSGHWAWTLLAILGGLQTVRVSTFRADNSLRWAAAFPFDDLAVEHECLPAYLYAAELANQAEDVYDAKHYPASATGPLPIVRTDVEGMAPHVDDPFFYPPTFLLASQLLLSLNLDYATLRSLIYGLNGLLVLFVALFAARFIGGRKGLTSAKFIPLLWMTIPFALALQFGQFHLAAFALSVGGLILIERDHSLSGGFLLAVAIAGKLFPAVLMFSLIGGKRWKALRWTSLWLAVFAVVAFSIFGFDIFKDFLHHLPRLSGGEAADFVEGDLRAIGENGSFFGIFEKLEFLGIGGVTAQMGAKLALPFTALIVALSWWTGRRSLGNDSKVASWLAILNLAAIRSPYAPAAYAFSGAVWLWSIMAPRAKHPLMIFLAILAIAALNGAPPMEDDRLRIAISLVGPSVLLILCAAAFCLSTKPEASSAAGCEVK